MGFDYVHHSFGFILRGFCLLGRGVLGVISGYFIFLSVFSLVRSQLKGVERDGAGWSGYMVYGA